MGSYDWISVVYDKATFVAFDTETTGLRPDENKVVEILKWLCLKKLKLLTILQMKC